jgi:ribonuclease HI
MTRAYIDGGARGNPGPAGYGVRIEAADGTLVAELYAPLGIATNNVAEYKGLIAALDYLVGHRHDDVEIRSDSELLVRQMRGEYKVKNEGLKPLYAQARLLAIQIPRLDIQHIRRVENQEADRLSNLAMDEAERALAGPEFGPSGRNLPGC